MQDIFTKENFKCDRHCGQCCIKLSVRISKAEIKNIRKLGYKEEDFLERELSDIPIFILKKNRKGCVFLKKHKGGKYSCVIYKNRPKACEQYPFFKENNKVGSCLPDKMFPGAFVSFSK